MPQTSDPPNDAPKREYLIPIKAFRCGRCGHVWLSAKNHDPGRPPRCCAHCKSPYWRSKRQLVGA